MSLWFLLVATQTGNRRGMHRDNLGFPLRCLALPMLSTI